MKTIKSKYFSLAAISVCALLISGCGGGSSIDAGALEIPFASKVQTLEGFDVTVTAFALSTSPTIPVRYEVELVTPTVVLNNGVRSDDGDEYITALIGTDYVSAKPVVVDGTSSQTVWSVAVPKPLIAAGNGLLVTFTLSDGDLFETGEKDFIF
jgi:hypothetical protein